MHDTQKIRGRGGTLFPLLLLPRIGYLTAHLKRVFAKYNYSSSSFFLVSSAFVVSSSSFLVAQNKSRLLLLLPRSILLLPSSCSFFLVSSSCRRVPVGRQQLTFCCAALLTWMRGIRMYMLICETVIIVWVHVVPHSLMYPSQLHLARPFTANQGMKCGRTIISISEQIIDFEGSRGCGALRRKPQKNKKQNKKYSQFNVLTGVKSTLWS